MKSALVAVQKTRPKSVLVDYARLMDLADYREHVRKDKETILKLNLSWSLYYPACSTEPWQLEGVVKKLKDDGYTGIHPVENRTVVTDVWKGAKGNKWLPIIKKYGLTYEPLTETKWVSYKPKHEMLALHEVFHPKYGKLSGRGGDDSSHDGPARKRMHDHGRGKDSVYQLPKVFMGKNVIHLPTMKTHGHTTITGAMKNAFGGLITMRRHHCHKRIHEVLVDLLQIQKEIHAGTFAVMDGAVAGDGAGPRTMVPRSLNTILASGDQVAIDAVSAHLMGYDPLQIPFIRMAHDRGLGCGDVRQIEFAGLSRRQVLGTNYHFRTQKSPVIFWDQMLRKGPLSVVEPALFHTKAFKACVFASEFYHDKAWYPTVGKRRIAAFEKTEWGKLWQTYE